MLVARGRERLDTVVAELAGRYNVASARSWPIDPSPCS